ncbi:MAG TPA: peptidoglycan recognition family protein [Mucilaginibacter sp.]|nr:peptidoglycan recognition family protein [Mucilaginibacter sp.]
MEIVQVKSPNYTSGRAGYKPIAIVIHIMEGSLKGTDSWFKSTSSQVSAHYGIGVNGEVHQYVQETDSAWHAGRVSSPTWSLIISSSPGKYVNPNYYTVGIEHEGYGNTVWTDAMYNASSAMIQDIALRWNIPIDRDHIIGHNEIYALKTCPGSQVDFDKLIAMAKAGAPAVAVAAAQPVFNKTAGSGKVTTKDQLNVRRGPSTSAKVVGVVPGNIQLAYDGYIDNGQTVSGSSKWFYTDEGNWFWSGGVTP